MERKQIDTIDKMQYIGEKVEIAKAEYIMTKFGAAIKFTSTVIPLKGKDQLDKPLVATRIFGLAKDKETGKLVIPIDGMLDKFLQAKNIQPESLPDFEEGIEIESCIGKKCVVQKNKNGFLEIA